MKLVIKSSALLIMVALVASPARADFAGKQSPKLPIEITADAFEVFQQENKAIFTGHVIAVQGKMNLKSDRMTVFYKSGGGANGISKINVDGNVLLASPEETASGEKGVYNVETKIVTLDGNVVLTKDKNIMKGAALVYNLATGQSELKGGVQAATGDAKTGAAKPGRVRALFVPGDEAEKPKTSGKREPK